MTEQDAMARLANELARLTKHIRILGSETATEWDIGNSTQHLPFALAASLNAINELIKTQSNSVQRIVSQEFMRLEQKNGTE